MTTGNPSRSPILIGNPMGTALLRMAEQAGLDADTLAQTHRYGSDILTLTAPGLVRSLYESYMEAGADVLVTNTLNSNAGFIGNTDLSDRLTIEGTRLAMAAANTKSGITVAASLGPLPHKKIPTDNIRKLYRRQIRIFLEEGVEIFMVETATSSSVAKIGAEIIAEESRRMGINSEIIVEFTLNTDRHILSGEHLGEGFTAVEKAGATVVGINCVWPASRACNAILDNKDTTSLPFSLRPSAAPDALSSPTSPEEFSSAFIPLLSSGRLAYAGTCCWGTPSHITALQRLKTHNP